MKIKNWAVNDRPREKLYRNGPKNLSDAELLAIIIATGTKSISAVELSRKILATANHDLNLLAKKSIKELCETKGVGLAKALMIRAMMELANRKSSNQSENSIQVRSSEDAFHSIRATFQDLKVEEFWVIYLNRGNRIISQKRISSGGVSGTVVDPKIIFHYALSDFACGLILAHNHPSGNLKPSQNDLQVTKKIAQAAEFLDMKLLDHLICSDNIYYSFADEGII